MAGSAVNVERRSRLAIGAAVTALHVAALVWLGLSVVPTLPQVTAQALDVVLMRPGPRPDVDRDSPAESGGAPAAPSRIHITADPRLDEVELNAPDAPAPLQPLVVGLSPVVTALPSAGDGGVGDGAGDGSGAGPGAGGGGVVLIQGPAGAIITQDVQPADLAQAGQIHVILRCRIRANQQLEDCRVVGEHPRPSGYRRAALERSREFRFRQHGRRPFGGRWVVVAIAFPPSGVEPETAPVDGN